MTTTGPQFVGPTTRSSLTALRRSMEDYFTHTGVKAQVYLGLRFRNRWDTSRVVLIDGEFDGSNTPKPMSAGTFGAPWHKKSYNPRELVGWTRPVTLSIYARDVSNLDNESAQVEASEALIEDTVRALQNAMVVDSQGNNIAIGQANVDWGGSKALWLEPGSSTEQTHGKEFLVTFQYKCVLFDAAEFYQTATPQVPSVIMLSNLTGGVNAAVASIGSGNAVINGLGFADPSYVGKNLKLSGAASAGNNGTFPIAFFISPQSLVIVNAGAVAPDANNGHIAWQVGQLQ